MWLLHASPIKQFWIFAGFAFLLILTLFILVVCFTLVGGGVIDLIIRLFKHRKFTKEFIGDSITKAFKDALKLTKSVALGVGIILFVIWLAMLGAIHQINLHYVLTQLLNH